LAKGFVPRVRKVRGVDIDRTTSSADEPDETEQGQPSRSEHPIPPDRLGEPGYPSRADARGAALEANQKPVEATTETDDESSGSEADLNPVREAPRQAEQDGESLDGTSQTYGTESDGTSVVPDADQGEDGEQKPADTYVSPLEGMPSYGDFANLDQELEARAKGREIAKLYDGPASDRASNTDSKRDLSSPPELDEESIKEQIDPLAPDLDKTEGRKEPFQRTVRDKGDEWTDGVEGFDDLPTGEKLAEGDESERSKGENFRKTLHQGYGDAENGVKKYTSTASDFFNPHPTGHAETRVDSGPVAADVHHSGIDPGSTASSVLALGIVGAELLRWGRDKIKERRGNEGHG
jgi:hypothetical protein